MRGSLLVMPTACGHDPLPLLTSLFLSEVADEAITVAGEASTVILEVLGTGDPDSVFADLEEVTVEIAVLEDVGFHGGLVEFHEANIT